MSRTNLGIHVFKNKSLCDSVVDITDKLPMIGAIQIMTHGPRNRREVKIDYKRFKQITSERNIKVYNHSSYPTNPWNGKPEIFNHTIDQFVASNLLGAKGVVLHIPKIIPEKVSKITKKIYDALIERKLLKNQKIILEMKAVKQDEFKSYESPEKINRLIELLIKDGMTSSNVGICIDTAHIYAGKANIQTYKNGINYLKKLKYPKWFCLLHLNGNEYDAKLRAGDKHAIPLDGKDKIWKNISYNNSGCKAFIEYCKKNNIDIILEIKQHHTIKQVNKFIKLIN